MDTNRYQRYMAAYRNLGLFPLLEAEDIEAFRVEYGRRTLARLKQAVVSSPTNGKVIFTGHRGSGKSTLLKQFERLMRDQNLFVAFFSIADMVEMSDVNHVNILYSIAITLLSRATKLKVPIPEATKNALLTWFTQTKSKSYTDQLQSELSAGVNLFDFLTGKLKKEDTFREEIKITYERRVSDLSAMIDRIATAIQTATQKEVLVIIDDLDKLDLSVVETIYRDNINALISPNIRVVFTIPISVVREPKLFAVIQAVSPIVLLAVTKFYPQAVAHQPNAEPDEKNVEILSAVLRKRIAADLVEPDTLHQMVLLSGGVLRELVQFNLLVKIYEDFAPPDARSAEFLELLHALYVLEYENDDLWYDLHPMVTELLRRKNMLPV